VNPDWSQSDSLLHQALTEDAVYEDVTTRALVSEDISAKAVLKAREEGVIAGLPVVGRLCENFFEKLTIRFLVDDGAEVGADSHIAIIEGSARELLSAERTALNFLQRLSGVATLTRKFVSSVAGTGVDIVDTRKTTPGWRALEKYAVVCGGGVNHRLSLKDQAMIKENHLRLIAACKKVSGTEALRCGISSVREVDPDVTLTVEVENIPQLRVALAREPDVILIDNMSHENIRQALECIQKVCSGGIKRPLVEVSGGVELGTVRSYALPGVDRISIGAITHSAPALDIAMDLQTSSSQP